MQKQDTPVNKIADIIITQVNRKLLLAIVTVIFVLGTGYALLQPAHQNPLHAHNNWDEFIYPSMS